VPAIWRRLRAWILVKNIYKNFTNGLRFSQDQTRHPARHKIFVWHLRLSRSGPDACTNQAQFQIHFFLKARCLQKCSAGFCLWLVQQQCGHAAVNTSAQA